jgi:hypothetical protein
MPRSGRLRLFIKEYRESPKFEKLSFILPFIILIFEGILLTHALTMEKIDLIIVELTTILLIISVFEIIFVFEELHDNYQRTNFDRILTIKLDDFITQTKKKNVKMIVEKFIEKYPKYNNHRNEIYHTCCQIMETHKEENIEEEISLKLNKFIKKTKETTVDNILKKFLKKYPKYKNNSDYIYRKICQILG